MTRHWLALVLVLVLCGTCGDDDGDKEQSQPCIGDWECESPTPNCVKGECSVGCVANYHCEPEMPYCLEGKCTADCTPVCPVMTHHGDCGMDDGCGGSCGCLPDEICRESGHIMGEHRCYYTCEYACAEIAECGVHAADYYGTHDCDCGECDDGNPCTDDVCEGAGNSEFPGRCEFVPSTAECDDGDACTLGDVCAEGVCVPGQVDPDC